MSSPAPPPTRPRTVPSPAADPPRSICREPARTELSPAHSWTARDLTDRFGPIPLDRILWDPPPGTATFGDVVRLIEAGRLVELVDGVLLEKAVGWIESRIAASLIKRFDRWDPQELLGTLTGADGFVRLATGNTRGPDLSFYAWDTLGRRLPTDAVPAVCPDFCVEVLSRSNTRREIDGKLDDLFASGCRLAWVLNPRTRTARLITPADPDAEPPAGRPWVAAEAGEDATLSGEPVLPGFEVRLGELLVRGPADEPAS